MMKLSKILLVLSSFTLAFSLAACGNNNPEEPDNPTYDDLITPPTYTEDSVSIHYYRADRDFEKWSLWLWDYPSGTGEEYSFNGVDNYGAIAAYPISTWGSSMLEKGLGFIVKSKGDWSKKDPDGDRIIDFSKFEKDANKIYNIYLKSGDANIYANGKFEQIESIESCQFTSSSTIEVKTNLNISSYKIYEDEKVIASETLSTPAKGFRYSLSGSTASFDKSYKVSVVFESSKKEVFSSISTRSLYKTDDFANNYTYARDDLGAIYTASKTTFKVWSPVSSKISLRIYDSGTPTSVNQNLGNDSYKEYTMTKGEKGIYSFELNGDYNEKYYTYVVTNYQYDEKEIVDPYAKSCGINGLRGQILDLSSTNPVGWDSISPLQIDRKSLVVYESHVSDITSSSTWGGYKDKSTLFNGAYQSNTTYTSNGTTVSTGFDNIKELGVNALQLQPIYDQANDETTRKFNWGYNPLNYNCLEGLYSSNPYDGKARIQEFKELVKAYNEAGINIIMDVVYNHVASAIGSNFDVLMPGYYFRYTSDGNLSNGSGCGNETASEMPMFRKFMIDSAKFWTKEYKLGGFRFDLMGLHDLKTMDQLAKECKEINKSIAIYGEPWTGGTSTLSDDSSAKQINGKFYNGYGQFNDQLRDSLIKGGLNSASALGWVDNLNNKMSTSDLEKLQGGIKGITILDNNSITDPDKNVSYVTCHDNYTLADRFLATLNFERADARVKKMNVLANSVVFTSQGTSFMLSGEEFLRTKGGDSNSYESSYQVNELNYALKLKNIDMYASYQKLIALKKEFDGLHQDSSTNRDIDYAQSSDANQISYTLKGSNKEYLIIHNNGYSESTLPSRDLSGYALYLDTIDSAKVLSSNTKFSAFETLIAYK